MDEPTEPTEPTELDSEGSATVLVVDDEPHLVGMYTAMLEDAHTVRTATRGEAALERFTDDVDVVLLDRRMPGLSGEDLLDVIRSEGYEYQVAMVTSVDPDLDIVELPFDAYIVKPIRGQDLRNLVENLLLRSRYSTGIQELLRTTSKLVALESQFDEDELDAHDEYRRLRERKERLERRNHERYRELVENRDTELVFRDVLGNTPEPRDERTQE